MRSIQTVTSLSYTSSVTITRPSNTTAYGAGDVIGVADVSVAANAGSAIHEFTNIGPAGGHILLTAADLMVYLAAVPASMANFRLDLFDSAPTAILDNAAFDIVAGDRTKHLGYIDIGTPADRGATLAVQSDQINKQFKLASGSTSLYGLLTTDGGYTPSSAEVLKVRLSAVAL
jgi:hypothetical protein